MNTLDTANALDPRSFNELKRLSKENSPAAIGAAAKQFEALFLQMVLKSMRDAGPKDGLMDSEQTRMFRSLLDQQLAIQMAGAGGTGLAEAIARQLGGTVGSAPGQAGGSGEIAAGFDALAGAAIRQAAKAAAERQGSGEGLPADAVTEAFSGIDAAAIPQGAREFVGKLWPHAMAASRETGIPAHFMIAQAALETGWGKAELRHQDGQPSYNLFNLKAGRSWRGETVALDALEYSNGQAIREPSRFRSYGSYAEAFRDYARLLKDNPRYSEVLGQQDAAGFARSLQQAGYATDPMYADKLTRIIGGNTLRTALGG
ncbi:MAG: flagellar assembly peptidoglycan hydrolase FlgJ [Rhodocyclaceae bacterium]|nr:flagellar assembly peptidoglycan hydrolase FlgJ [Rhodocyclaceae bacterium]